MADLNVKGKYVLLEKIIPTNMDTEFLASDADRQAGGQYGVYGVGTDVAAAEAGDTVLLDPDAILPSVEVEDRQFFICQEHQIVAVFTGDN